LGWGDAEAGGKDAVQPRIQERRNSERKVMRELKGVDQNDLGKSCQVFDPGAYCGSYSTPPGADDTLAG
jgi:hypothetical protein